MGIYVKNLKLKNKVFKKINYFSNKAIKFYEKGKMDLGLKYEKKSDSIYANNYNKIFKIKKK